MFRKAGDSAKSIFDKSIDYAVNIADQNDDGKFDKEDMAAIVGNVGSVMKKGATAVKETAEESSRKLELKLLQPFFPENLDEADFFMSKFIRVTDRDKKHAESEVCQGSIGYLSEQKGMKYVNIFKDSLGAFGLTFMPDAESEFYYIDPSDRDRYIALDDYFGHMKVMRINELQRIAQDLGAKHFRVTFKEEKKTLIELNNEVKVKVGKVGGVDGEHEASEKKYSTIEIAAEMDFPGHAPIRPSLRYLKTDPSILNLVEMRMNEKAPLMHQHYVLKMSNSSGIKVSDAVKIDAVIKGVKMAGNVSVESEVQSEARRYLEYEIDFI